MIEPNSIDTNSKNKISIRNKENIEQSWSRLKKNVLTTPHQALGETVQRRYQIEISGKEKSLFDTAQIESKH